MNTRLIRGLTLLGLLALLPLPGPAEAQQQRRQQRPPRAEMEAQIRQRFQRMVWRELGLDQEQGQALAAVVEDFQEPRRELAQRQRMLQRRMSGTGALLSESEARSVLDELVAVREAEVELIRNERERLLEILEPPQLVRFYMLRERFGARIRALREGGGPGPGGPPSGGGGTGLLWPVLEY